MARLADRVDQRLRAHPAADSLWPGHWSQMLGHAALVAMLLLVVTGIYLAAVYSPGIDPVTYQGASTLHAGERLPRAFASVVHISHDLPGGLLIRRVHAASAHLLVAAIVVHLVRVMATGSFQGRRRLNHVLGVGLFGVALAAGWTGENLLFSLRAGTSLRVGYSVLGSIPYVGEPLALLAYGGDFPTGTVLRRLSWLHSLVLPAALIGGSILHVWLYRRHTPTEVRGAGDQRTVLGVPLWPDLTGRLVVLVLATAGLVLVSSGLIPWSDVELEGPYRLTHVGNTLQPPWFLFLPEGAMRLLPAIDLPLPGGARIGNVFLAGAVLPGLLIGLVALYPWIDPRLGGSRSAQHVLEHPLAVRGRAVTLAVLATVHALLALGATVDVIASIIGQGVEDVINAMRVLLVVGPLAAAGWVWLAAGKHHAGRTR